jgi:hypothetical protein
MRMNKLISATALSLLGMAANAEVIDFNELAHDAFDRGVNPLVSGGYTFACTPVSDINCLGVFGRSNAWQADPGFAAVFVGYPGAATMMTTVGGGSFDFYSIDLGDIFNSGASVTVDFSFVHSVGGTSGVTVTLDSAPGMETFTFAKTGLSSVTWVTTSGANLYNQFDNVATAVVPEPQTSLLMLSGLAFMGLFGASRHLRDKATT